MFGGKKKMKKIIIGIVIILILLFLPGATLANEFLSVKNSQSDIVVTIEVDGSGRIFDISTSISNIGDEK